MYISFCTAAAVTPGGVTPAAVTADEAALYSMYDDEYPELKPSLLQLSQHNETSVAAASVSATTTVAGRRLHSRAQTSMGFHRATATTTGDSIGINSRIGGSSGSNTG
jgi:hypothetical protein